jgi:hypothetical protein
VQSAAVLVAALRGRAGPRSPSNAPLGGADPAVRHRRIDATEAYIAGSVEWLFDGSVGNRPSLAECDRFIVGVPYGHVEVRLLSDGLALEYASLCRWLWERADEGRDVAEAIERVRLFRSRLHDHLEGQRTLVDRGRAPTELAPEIAATLARILDEAMSYRAELVEAAAHANR